MPGAPPREKLPSTGSPVGVLRPTRRVAVPIGKTVMAAPLFGGHKVASGAIQPVD